MKEKGRIVFKGVVTPRLWGEYVRALYKWRCEHMNGTTRDEAPVITDAEANGDDVPFDSDYDFRWALLSCADVRRSSFFGAMFKGICFNRAAFANCTFTDCSFDGSSFRSNAKFNSCYFNNCYFYKVAFDTLTVKHCVFRNCFFFGDKAISTKSFPKKTSDCTFDGCRFKNTYIREGSVHNTAFVDCILERSFCNDYKNDIRIIRCHVS